MGNSHAYQFQRHFPQRQGKLEIDRFRIKQVRIAAMPGDHMTPVTNRLGVPP